MELITFRSRLTSLLVVLKDLVERFIQTVVKTRQLNIPGSGVYHADFPSQINRLITALVCFRYFHHNKQTNKTAFHTEHSLKRLIGQYHSYQTSVENGVSCHFTRQP